MNWGRVHDFQVETRRGGMRRERGWRGLGAISKIRLSGGLAIYAKLIYFSPHMSL